jgi:hypothetical protein
MSRLDLALKFLALVSATLFFGYKLLAGSLAAPTSLGVAASTVKCAKKLCAAIVKIEIQRGDNWGAYVECAELTLVVDGERSKPIAIQYKYHDRPSFELSPGEKTQYGAVVEVPEGKLAVVEVLFVMQQKHWLRDPAYVFGSAVVSPLTTNAQSIEANAPLTAASEQRACSCPSSLSALLLGQQPDSDDAEKGTSGQL